MKKTESNKNRLYSNLYFGASICFYISAIFNFISSGGNMVLVYLCLGSIFLGLGAKYLSKLKKEDNDVDEQNEK